MKTKPTKAWVGAVGSTLTALTTFWASTAVFLSDDAVDFNEIGSLVSLGLSLGGTVYGIWRTENKPVVDTQL